jgi:succinate dehydrogenase/fumarate reductase flavoprotein subunit
VTTAAASVTRHAEGMDADLIVVGGGMAGMTAAARVAITGRRVVVVERAPDIGGSAVLPGGNLWTAPTLAAFATEDPWADQRLARVLVDGLAGMAEWLRGLGIAIEDPRRVQHGIGYRFDVGGYIARCAQLVRRGGGHILSEFVTSRLIFDGATVSGIEGHDRDGAARLHAPWTVLATGGFQNDPVLRDEFFGPDAARMLVRSNPVSAGDGLRLADRVGAARSVPHPRGFYGHLVASPLTSWQPGDYSRLAMLSSDHCVLVNEHGRRFTDESRGDHHNAQAVLDQPGGRAVALLDAELRDYLATSPHSVGAMHIDRLTEAEAAGARVQTCATWPELAAALDAWGCDGRAAVDETIAFNQAIRSGKGPDCPLRTGRRTAVDTPPFSAIELRPAITFTFGGIRIDRDARVLDGAGLPIPGLLAAGADAAGVYDRGYAGGLMLASAFASAAARQVLAAPPNRADPDRAEPDRSDPEQGLADPNPPMAHTP